VAAYIGINAGGYLPIALPAENSNLAEAYFGGICDLGGFFSGIKYHIFLKTMNRTGHGGYEMRFEWLISTTRCNQVTLE